MYKVMSIDGLDKVMSRLDGCCALLYILGANAGANVVGEAALCAAADLLESICRDFQTVIDAAFTREAEQA